MINDDLMIEDKLIHAYPPHDVPFLQISPCGATEGRSLAHRGGRSLGRLRFGALRCSRGPHLGSWVVAVGVTWGSPGVAPGVAPGFKAWLVGIQRAELILERAELKQVGPSWNQEIRICFLQPLKFLRSKSWCPLNRGLNWSQSEETVRRQTDGALSTGRG